MTQRLQDTDGFILIEYGNAVQTLREQAKAGEMAPEQFDREHTAMLRKYAERLRNNGHDKKTICELLAAAYNARI